MARLVAGRIATLMRERAGDIAMTPGAIDSMKETMPGLRRAVLLPGCGHWTQQERPDEVNRELLEFLAEL